MDKLTIDIGFADLAVCKTEDGPFRELNIHLEEKSTGLIHQDIALVRASINDDLQPIPDSVDCIVWSNSENEDYTYKLAISNYAHKEEGKP